MAYNPAYYTEYIVNKIDSIPKAVSDDLHAMIQKSLYNDACKYADEMDVPKPVRFEEFDKDGKHYTYVHFLDYFEDETRGELIKKFCPKHGEGLVYIDDGSGTIIREEAYYRLWDDEDTKTVISHEDYEAEIYEITKDAEIIHPEFREFIPE